LLTARAGKKNERKNHNKLHNLSSGFIAHERIKRSQRVQESGRQHRLLSDVCKAAGSSVSRMTAPVQLSQFVKPQDKVVDEPDRYPLQAGIRFVITDFAFTDSRKYGQSSIVKINGYDIITGQKLKYRTTAKKVIDTLKRLAEAAGVDDTGKLKTEVKVLVASYKSENGTGLELQDAA
jgi:translation elongation factor P/translation initiation factor 5A